VAANRIYFDTNIFIEMIEENSREAGQLLIDLFSSNDGSQPAYIFTSELTLAELLTGPYKKNNQELINTYDNILTPGGNLVMCPVSRELLWQSAVFRAKYTSMKLPDAIHVTTAIAYGCTHFLTADKGISGSFEHYSQFNQLAGKTTLEAVRPTQSLIEKLISESKI
jgi:uncharacterized protein